MEFVTSGLGSAVQATAILAALIFVWHTLGEFVLARILNPSPKFERPLVSVFSIIGGMWLFMAGVYALGQCGLLKPVVCRIYGVVLFAVCAVFKARRRAGGIRIAIPSFKPKGWTLLYCLVVTIFAVLTWVKAVAPPTGNDALAYHLTHARYFVLHHTIGHLPETRESLWPYFVEVLFSYGMAVHGTGLAQLIDWFFYPFTAFMIAAVARSLWGVKASRWAALVFLSTPAVIAQTSLAYVDLAFAAFLLAALVPFACGNKLTERNAVLLSALGMGSLLGTKYIAIAFAGILTVLWYFVAQKKIRSVVLFILVSSLLSFFWYLKSWWVLGNPVYPFFHKVFGSGYPLQLGEGVGFGRDPLSLILLPWNMTLFPAPFGGPSIGPLYLVFLPLLILRLFKNAKIWMWAWFWTVFLGSWYLFFESQQVRFFLCFIPMGAVAAAGAWRRVSAWQGSVSNILQFLFYLPVCLGLLLAAYHSRGVWEVLWYRQSAEEYLMKNERAYRAYKFFEPLVASGRRVFNAADVRWFYRKSERLAGFNERFFYELKLQGKSIEQMLDEGRYEWIWINRISYPEFWDYVKSRGYERVGGYTFHEGEVAYDYSYYRKDWV